MMMMMMECGFGVSCFREEQAAMIRPSPRRVLKVETPGSVCQRGGGGVIRKRRKQVSGRTTCSE